jgi:hypothetical protein
MEGGDRRAAGLARTHRDRHLAQAQRVLRDHHRGLGLGIVVRVVRGEEADALPVGGLEAGGRIRDALPRQRRDAQREQPDADAPRA